MRILLIAIAGAVGTLCRYGASTLLKRAAPSWPLGTLAANIVGCFVLALIAALAMKAGRVSEDARVAISVGFCGGLTTYSSFNHELLEMLGAQRGPAAVGYFVATVGLSAAAGALGLVIGRAFS